MFPLKQICNRIPVDKATIKKTANNSQAMLYANYVGGNRRIYKTIIEGQVTEIKMIRATPNTATVTYTFVAKPLYIEMVVINIQDIGDTQSFNVYENPFVITNLRPNSYYTINAYTVYISNNRYLNVFENAVRTLYEGPPLEPIFITNPEYDSAILHFTKAIGVPTSINLTVLNNANTSDRFFYPNITSPYLITGLTPNVTYDISLSSFYEKTQNSYSAEYKTRIFETYNENYPVFLGVSNITNVGATITFRYTGFPSQNIIKVTNVKIPTNIVTITKTNSDTVITFDTLPIDSSFNLTITSIYNATGHIYPVNIPNVFHTLNESPVPVVTVISILGDAFSIQFIKAAGNVLSYDVTIVGVNGQTIHYNYTTVPPYIEFPFLAVFTNYTLTIRSNYIVNTYTYTYPGYIQTLNEGPIAEITYSNVENTSAQVSFQPAPGINQQYNIIYQGQRNNTTVYYINGLTTTSFNLTGLTINTPYLFTIYSYYPSYGNYYKYVYTNVDTNNALFTTLNQNASTIFSVVPTSNSIVIQFINIYGSPTLFTLYAKDAFNQIISSDTYIGASNNTVTKTLTGLTASTAYTISMVTNYDSRNYTTVYSGNPVTTLPM
jgi:hypothetical protein